MSLENNFDKEFSTRITLKYDTESSWQSVENTFTPLAGEIIIYSDLVHQIKIGNGVDLLKNLPFIDDHVANFQGLDAAGKLMTVDNYGYVQPTAITWGLLANIDESEPYVMNNLLYLINDESVENSYLQFNNEDVYVDDEGILHIE